jgi:GGDEF domain-containing protein
VREHATSLAAKVRSLADITGSVQSPLFKTDMRAVIDGEPRLLLLSLHSPQDGIVYLVARERSFMKEPAQITPEWRGTPVYKVNKGSELLVTATVSSDMPGLTMDTLFVVMGNDDLYPVVRDDLYFFLAFLLVCGVIILIVMSVQPDAEPAGGGFGVSPAPEPPGASSPSRATPQSPPGGRPHDGPPPLTSPRTGLVWAEYLQPRLKAELARAASSDQDISLAHLRIDGSSQDTHGARAYEHIAKIVIQTFPLHDLIFETGDDSYTLILPDADVDAAVRLLDELRRKLSVQAVEGRTRTLSVGVSSRGGRLIDEQVLRDEADVALAKASREGGNQVIGFRADAARFRETLAGS